MSLESSERKYGRRGFHAGLENSNIDDLRIPEAQLTKKESAAAEWITDRLDRIHFETIYDILSEMYRKSGGPEEYENFVPREHVFVLPASELKGYEKFMMLYDRRRNAVAINADAFAGLLQKRAEPELTYIFLSGVIHEYIHAMGTNTEEEIAGATEFQMGYLLASESNDAPNTVLQFNLLNEGITILIQRRATAEYLRRNPITLPDNTVIGRREVRREEGRHNRIYEEAPEYEVARIFIERLCRHLGEVCELPEETLQDAFISGYFDGTALKGDSGELLEEILGPDFKIALSHANKRQDLEKIAREYKFPPVSVTLKEIVWKKFPSLRPIFRRVYD